MKIIRYFVQTTIFKRVLDNNYNALYDSPCANLYFCANSVFGGNNRLRTFIGVYAPLKDIIPRCETRGKNEGRFVPIKMLREDHENLYGNDERDVKYKLKAYNYFKRMLKQNEKIFMYDNTNKQPNLITSNDLMKI